MISLPAVRIFHQGRIPVPTPLRAHSAPKYSAAHLDTANTPLEIDTASPSSPEGLSGIPTLGRGLRQVCLHRIQGPGGKSGERSDMCPTPLENHDCVLCGGLSRPALKSPAPSIPRGRGLTIQLSHFYYAGAITTKRRGSSPSDRVTIPSRPVRPSWMALRSAGDIGSRARSSPVSTTSTATC